jgi:hypothetical protein
MEDSKLYCLAKALGDAARVVVGSKIVMRLANFLRKRIERSKSEAPQSRAGLAAENSDLTKAKSRNALNRKIQRDVRDFGKELLCLQ